jgi:hypothetical protein
MKRQNIYLEATVTNEHKILLQIVCSNVHNTTTQYGDLLEQLAAKRS